MRLLVIAALTVALCGRAAADGGVVRVSQVSGPLRLTVFSAPTPLRAGAIDLSVLVQTSDDDATVLDATVAVAVYRTDDPQHALHTAATHDAATNKLLYAALLTLPAPGQWTVEVTANRETVRFAMDADAALPDAVTFWPYLLLPFVALGLFAVHQWRVLRAAKS
ncbi:MAG: hypothetical protein ABI629_22320 [bacterium]